MTMLAGLALLFGAVVCFVFGAKQLTDTKKKQAACTAPAAARLLRYDEETRTETDEDSGDIVQVTYHYPVFRYEARGVQREVRCAGAMSKDTWAIGAPVSILYDPNLPERFVIAGDKNANALGFVVLATGLLCLVFGIAMLF